MPLGSYIDRFLGRDKIGSFLCVKPTQAFHVVSMDGDDLVSDIQHVTRAGLWINGGYFVFRKEIFQYLRDGEELVVEPFQRLIAASQLIGYKYDGFWACMDTF